MQTIIIIVVLGLIILFKAIRVVREYERGVVFPFGKTSSCKGSGYISAHSLY